MTQCHSCTRSPNDWIAVNGVLWEPDIREVRPGTWTCWACRGEPHPDMPEGYVPEGFWRKVEAAT